MNQSYDPQGNMKECMDLMSGDISDLEQNDFPSLNLHQHVTIISGPYQGKAGKVHRVREESAPDKPAFSSHRIEIILDATQEHVWVSDDEIDHKFESIAISLYMDDDERAAFMARCKEFEEHYKYPEI